MKLIESTGNSSLNFQIDQCLREGGRHFEHPLYSIRVRDTKHINNKKIISLPQ